MRTFRSGGAALFFGSLAVFWPGAIIFGLPGAFGPHWQEALGADRAALGRSLFFLLAGAGSCMALTGKLFDRLGPRRLAVFGSLVTGMATAGLCLFGDLSAVYAWAFLCGAASSFVYIPVLTVAQLWYPERRGLVSGFVNMVFGMSAAPLAPLAAWLLTGWGYGPAVVAVGGTAAAVGAGAALFIRRPPAPAVPASGQRLRASAPEAPSLAATLRTRTFWFLWLTWAFAGAGGITLIVFATLFGTDRGLPLERAVLLASAFNLASGAGRMVSGLLSDRFGRAPVMSAAFAAAAAGYLAMPHLDLFGGWALCTALVGYAFGTQFSVSAPLIIECFGIASFGVVFGAVFTAYGFFSGVLGPWAGGLILEAAGGDFRPVFLYLGGLYLAAALLVRAARPARR